MLGQPVSMTVPRVVGCHLAGRLRPGVTATDLVLTIVERLRAHGVVGSFVEYFGPGLGSLSLSDRATLANMAPEYGATMGFFPIDGERSEEHTSELQSLMRISYAVFCLKKKKELTANQLHPSTSRSAA